MFGKGLLKELCCKTFCLNICSEIVINANFHSSHYKSMETLSCHSNQSFSVMAIKNKSFEEAYAMNNSAKCKLYHPYSFTS